jgi:HD-GYP domain-containing protein (c-di-GMP phosphodiesterase class II)
MDILMPSELVRRHAAWLVPHGERVARIATTLGERFGLDACHQERLSAAAQLHDVGKVHVQADIVNKPGPLDPNEWKEMRQHPVHGYWLLCRVVQHQIAETVLCHHERYDGTGYPFGLSGTTVPLLSRVLAVADAYDAMTSDRPYRPAIDPAAARLELEFNAGSQFDPAVVQAMIDLIDERLLPAIA